MKEIIRCGTKISVFFSKHTVVVLKKCRSICPALYKYHIFKMDFVLNVVKTNCHCNQVYFLLKLINVLCSIFISRYISITRMTI